jgi:hypothetical protein
MIRTEMGTVIPKGREDREANSPRRNSHQTQFYLL